MDESDNKIKLIKQYCKAIIDMRQKVEDNELILCFGAGVSYSWGIPNWKELVSRIASNEQVKGEQIFNTQMSLSSIIQALYEKFKKNQQEHLINSKDLFPEDHIRYNWIEIIRHELYKNRKSEILHHPYLGQYLEIIKKSPITINYNFDDLIEQLIIKSETTKNENIQNRKIQSPKKWGKIIDTTENLSVSFKKPGVIIHPNGFLPESLVDSISDHFVFSEKSFQDQLRDSIMGYYNPIMYYFSRYTTLFIGLSLTDSTLRHLLRQNAITNPGHFNYYIYYYKDKPELSTEEMKSIQESYFDTFNLIVLFMNDSEIEQLGYLLNQPHDSLVDLLCGEGLNTVCNYYISGAPGTGKTSVLNMMKSYKVYSEFDEKNEALYEDDSTLSEDERNELNKWIAKQFRYRNREIKKVDLGIQIIDRSPLDPITYAQNIVEHSNKLRQEYKRTSQDLDLVSGHIILLYAELEELYRRLHKRNPNKYNEKWCTTRSYTFENLFDCKDVKKIDTSHKSIAEITKEIAHFIYFEDYRPINLNNYMKEYCDGKRDLGQSKKKSSGKKGTQSTRDIK